MLQFAEQMPVQMGPNITHSGQIVNVDGVRHVLDDLVHTETLVFVRFQFGVVRFQRASETAKQHVLPDQRVNELNMRHRNVSNKRRTSGYSLPF